MSAGRVAGDVQPVVRRAEVAAVAVQPRPGLEDLAHDVLHGHGGTQRIVDHRHGNAGFGERARNERVLALVQRAPIAAMDEHQQPAARTFGAEHVELFHRVAAVGQVQVALQSGTGLFGALAPAFEVLGVFGNGKPRVVPGLVVLGVFFHCSWLLVVRWYFTRNQDRP